MSVRSERPEEARPGPKRSRLHPLKTNPVVPFSRATAVTDASIYWIPVSHYPLPVREREWLREFHRRLIAHLKREADIREEIFLQFKSLYPNLLDRFTETSTEYIPMTGVAIVPGTTPPALPDLEAVKKEVEKAGSDGGPLDVTRWMPDHLHWFVAKKPEEQRADFFGNGGMLTLYLPRDPETAVPEIKFPRLVTSHPAYSDSIYSEIQAIYSLRDKFLGHSKEIFGEPFRTHPSYKGLLFILPLFTGASLLAAAPEQRAKWFQLFDGYFIESKDEGGMLLALKNPDFDESLATILEEMQEAGFAYSR